MAGDDGGAVGYLGGFKAVWCAVLTKCFARVDAGRMDWWIFVPSGAASHAKFGMVSASHVNADCEHLPSLLGLYGGLKRSVIVGVIDCVLLYTLSTSSS